MVSNIRIVYMLLFSAQRLKDIDPPEPKSHRTYRISRHPQFHRDATESVNWQ
jgi:hypothetical protein